jgi:hypothetical protein
MPKGGTSMFGYRKIKIYEDDGSVNETDVYLPQIRNIVGFLEGTWDLNMYANCFEGGNKLGDVDASIELYGWTLHVEFKRTRNDLNKGQVLKAIRQARHSDITTIFVFGDTNRPVEKLVFSPDNLVGSGIHPTNVMDLSKFFGDWGKWAKANSRIKGENDWSIVNQYVRKGK